MQFKKVVFVINGLLVLVAVSTSSIADLAYTSTTTDVRVNTRAFTWAVAESTVLN